MTETARNIATVEAIYVAIGRADIPTVLKHLREDIDWEFGASDHGVPWLLPGKGRESASRFFESLHQLQVHRFELLAITGSGPWVVGLIAIEFTVRATGRRVREECEAQIWRFDEHGLVAAMRHAADTYQHHAAARIN